jgi:glucose/arabinose dehydrogenase
MTLKVLSAMAAAALLSGCAETSLLAPGADYGPNPQLAAPRKGLIPTVNIAKATGWPPGGMPVAAAGLKVNAFVTGLDHPRWLLALPNGDVLVAETNAPSRPADGKGVRGFFMKIAMRNAGAAAPSANRITLLRDADGDGVAEARFTLIDGLNSPFGMALAGASLYIANSDALVRAPFAPGQTAIMAAPVKVADLPGGPLNHHWTKNVIASADGARLFVTTGSNSNVGEHGLAAEADRAAIWQVDPATGAHRIFASGLRNPNGLAWEPTTGALWTAVNERDEIGSDLVPDYITSVKDGAFYGWPFSYYGGHVDQRVQPPRPDMVAQAIAPDYATGAHTASLGLAFATANTLTPAWRSGAFVGQHGSWNRRPHAGYRVIFVPFAGGAPSGPPRELLTGFLREGRAQGRPVGVAVTGRGDLLVADDVGNVIWRVSAG